MKRTLSLLTLVVLFLSACTSVQKTSITSRKIFYAGENNGVKNVLQELGYTFVDDFNQAEVFVLNGEIPGPYAITTCLKNGAGLVLIPGKHMSYYGSDIDVQALLGDTVGDLMINNNPVSVEVDEFFGKDDPLITEIDWQNAPQIRERAFLMGPRLGEPLVRVQKYNEVILAKITDTQFYLSAYLDEQHNLEFQKWKYFNYLIYHLVERAAGGDPFSFADYEATLR